MQNATASAENVSQMYASAAAEAAAVKKDETSKRMTLWGAIWRIGGAVLLLVAVVVAVVLGMNYALTYVTALGLSATMTTVAVVAINVVSFLASGLAGRIAGGFISKVLVKRAATKIADAAA